MSFTFYTFCDFVGTVAFAISGIRLASAKRFDWFGAYVVGVTTAIGGGTIRDLMLGATPFWMENPFYMICSAFALIWVVIFRKWLVKQDYTWFIFDTIGLALFTVTGMERTLNVGFPYWTAIIMGTITGAGGGVIRDVLTNEIPLVFRKEIYAMACVFGGAIYATEKVLGFNTFICAISCALAVVLMRFLAVKYQLQLPTLKPEVEETPPSSPEEDE